MINRLIKKIFNNLIRPHKVPTKILNKINYYYKYKKYNQNLFEKKQNDLFNHYGLNREKGLENLNFVKKNLAKNFDINREMSSEHEVFFSSLSLNKGHSINEILEIGTFDGFNALLLSKLFKKTNIDTIDLPENDEDFINFYDRKNKVNKFIQDRDDILSKNEDIKFFTLNSLKLLNHKKKYDLIWIDGAHGYPIVCIDIINSLHILNENGIIVCDDVHKNLNQIDSDKMYHSIASYETLNELNKENLIKFKLIYKRLDPKNNCLESERKFLAIVTKH
tara:strand:- start:2959 stop:3792 length:834 start_codon:yes stop_codon:yes gene_type:complete